MMWEHAEVAGLVDADGRIAVVSRNEDEAPIKDIVGRQIIDVVCDESRPAFQAAFGAALNGKESLTVVSAVADDGYEIYARVHTMPSPIEESPVLFHLRRLPKSWRLLSSRERDVVETLHNADMNPKKAARRLGISVNTLNAHRRSICQKCGLAGVGDFWVFVERCR